MTRPPMISGHCLTPQHDHPERSHERCQVKGHGQSANPDHEFVPCPCDCHLGETFECECGGTIREAPHWDPYADEMIYVHVNVETGRAIGEECWS